MNVSMSDEHAWSRAANRAPLTCTELWPLDWPRRADLHRTNPRALRRAACGYEAAFAV